MVKKNRPAHGFKRVTHVDADTALPLDLEIEAGPGERERLAAWLGIPEVQSLRAQVRVDRWRERGVHVEGHFDAKVVQTCVVTLEPLPADVSGNFTRSFFPKVKEEPEVDVAMGESEPPEELTKEGPDLGALLAEELSLNLDPYPRKPGAEFIDPVNTNKLLEKAKPSPFAVLEVLKKKPK